MRPGPRLGLGTKAGKMGNGKMGKGSEMVDGGYGGRQKQCHHAEGCAAGNETEGRKERRASGGGRADRPADDVQAAIAGHYPGMGKKRTEGNTSVVLVAKM